ncbi:MAG: EF2563 family selenium-dependent molybdenum hydroxylase system protein [Enterococcaceae bacterium]|jgi:xanthine dehydrogenase accessory factor|nr:EF2563 family selenium-dependent molybdenum hydroxylase system protein [Enterococcaceae bacterium]MCI1920234.1 EF2563 family selenium-dependent molybdenum hydroxylase system protein [Enterococcaceae bacterium]
MAKAKLINETIVAVRGGGDLATGTIQKLFRSGFKVIILETANPLAIRRTVALCEAIRSGEFSVEGMIAKRIEVPEEAEAVWAAGKIPIMVDPTGEKVQALQPTAVIDAILAKKNLGTTKEMAPIVIALGPGFDAGQDCDAVIETMRGHRLGRIIFAGKPIPNTGIPGVLGGKSAERVVHSPANGVIKHLHEIGDSVKKGETLFYVGDIAVPSPLTGILRGLILDGIRVPEGMKVADVDPRSKEEVDYMTISDKARTIGGGALEALLYFGQKKSLIA